MNLFQKAKIYAASAAAAFGLSSCLSTGPGPGYPPAYGSGGIGYAPPIAPGLANGYFNGGQNYRPNISGVGYDSYAEIKARRSMIGREIAAARKSGDYKSEFRLRVEQQNLLEASRYASRQRQAQRNLSDPMYDPRYQAQREVRQQINRVIRQATRELSNGVRR